LYFTILRTGEVFLFLFSFPRTLHSRPWISSNPALSYGSLRSIDRPIRGRKGIRKQETNRRRKRRSKEQKKIIAYPDSLLRELQLHCRWIVFVVAFGRDRSSLHWQSISVYLGFRALHLQNPVQ
jgi:hypothetical protein